MRFQVAAGDHHLLRAFHKQAGEPYRIGVVIFISLDEILRRYFQEIVRKGNLDAISDFVSPDLVFWGPYASEPIQGLQKFTELIAMLHAAFDDFYIIEEEMIGEGTG